MINPAITKHIGIQSGAVTHHQLHLATAPISANFNTKNTMNVNPQTPIPDDELDDDFDIVFKKLVRHKP